MDLEDSLVYVASAGLQCVNVSNPTAPVIVGSWPGMPKAVDVVDTIVYAGGMYNFVTLDVSNPEAPRTLDSIWMVDVLNGVAVADTLAFAGGNDLHVYSVADPTNIQEVGNWRPPYAVSRLYYRPPHLYASCFNAGICILETTLVGISEDDGVRVETGLLRLSPNPARLGAWVRRSVELAVRGQWSLLDMTGKVVLAGSLQPGQSRTWLDLKGTSAGVYVVELRTSLGVQRGKLVKL